MPNNDPRRAKRNNFYLPRDHCSRINGGENSPTTVASRFILVKVDGNTNGHVDAESIRTLAVALTEVAGKKESKDVVVDLSGVRSLTSHFLNVLATFRNRFRAHNRRLFVVGVANNCVNILRVAGLEHIIAYFDSSYHGVSR